MRVSLLDSFFLWRGTNLIKTQIPDVLFSKKGGVTVHSVGSRLF
jgi:hypothetical protein